MLKKLQATKNITDPFLLELLDEESQKFQGQTLSQAAFAKLKNFIISGKSVRSGLFLLVAESFKRENYLKKRSDLILVAAALELIHSGLLIHDDIIDQDELRRGQDSIWHQYAKEAREGKINNPQNYGESLAICLGSLTQYLAQLALERLSLLPATTQKVIKRTINQEIIKTYFAEMLDSKITLQTNAPTPSEVEEMYLFKTARYTFSLPLQLASIINQQSTKQVEKIVKIGEKLGLIFQIKDDEISLFASAEKSGKSFASDIREGKKTLHYLYVLESANSLEKEFLQEFYGQKEIDQQKIEQIQKLFKKHANAKIEALSEKLAAEAASLIAEISSEKTRELLTTTLNFNLTRES